MIKQLRKLVTSLREAPGVVSIRRRRWEQFFKSSTRGNFFMFDDHSFEQATIDYFIWVIRNDNRTILVDTGFETKEAEDRAAPLDRVAGEILAAL